MDAYDIITNMSEYLARQERFVWFGIGWYIFGDFRTGTPVNNWTNDRETFNLLRS